MDWEKTYQRLIEFPGEDLTLLDAPYPICERSVEDEVYDHGPEGPELGGVPPELEIGVEGCAGDEDGGVAECESDVGEEMRLLEFERG